MTAVAAQYRESRAIEQAIQADPTAHQAWLKRQLVLDPVVIDDADGEDEVRAGSAVAQVALA